MIINSTGIEKLLRNYLEIEQTEEGLVIHRFTKRQRSVYDSQENWKIRARCPSGVSLEMFTNARFIRLLFSILGRTRDWSFFDLFINDIFLDSQSSHFHDGVLHTVEFEFAGKQEKDLQRVTIYLPHNIYLALQSVEIIDGEALPVTGSIHKKLLCLGDSITQGMDAYYPSNTYPVQLARFFEMDLLNQGVGGYIFNACSLDEEIPYKPDLVTVAYGTNDWGIHSEHKEFMRECSLYMERLTDIFSEAKIFVITPLWRADSDQPSPMGPFSTLQKTISSVCSAYPQITVLQGLNMMPNLNRYFTDGLHPTDEGNGHYSISLIKSLLDNGIKS